MNQAYSVHVVPDETTEGSLCYLAYHPELQGCMSHGLTVEEAIQNLDAARELYLATLQQLNQPIPPSPGKARTVVIWQNFSGSSKAVQISPSAAALPTIELTPSH